MADSSAIISSSGGIAAGTPFVLGQYLFIEQVSPPVAAGGRLVQTTPADPFQSITAVGSQGSAHSFVLGEDAEDSANGPRSVLIGYKLRQNTGGGAGQAADQVIIGNSIQLPTASRNSQGFIGIGAAQVFTAFLGVADSFGNSVLIGNTAALICINAGAGDASNAICIGPGASAHGGSVVLGASATDSNTTAVVIGQNALGGLQSVAIGLAADATAARSISIGNRARAGTADTIAIGWFADTANSDSSIVIGKQASSMAKFANIMIGRNAAVAADNFCQIGGDATYFISELRFGAGNSQATGGNTYTFSITDVFTGAGANLQGNGLVIKSGSGTGNWANTQNRGIDLQCGLLQATGSTQQPPTSVLALRHSDLNVALWGGLGAPFSGGAGVLFIKNAATNPTVAAVAGGGILSVQGGELHWLSSAGVDNALTPVGGGSLPITSSAGGLVYNAGAAFTATHNFEVNSSSALTIALTAAGGITTLSATTLHLTCTGGNNVVISTASGNVDMAPAGVVVASFQNIAGHYILPGSDAAVLPTGLGTSGLRFGSLFLSGAHALSIDNSTTAAAAQVATFTNWPTGKAGNPTKFLNVLVDGSNVVIPCW